MSISEQYEFVLESFADEILEHLPSDGFVTLTDIADQLDIGMYSADKALERLWERGVIAVVEGDTPTQVKVGRT